ncbi:hypothetical protein GA0115233_1012102 [Streptomyces sp. DI166]|nr:hypothetical protein GA0115233_1012102 [Streptomyces sp. DI166]
MGESDSVMEVSLLALPKAVAELRRAVRDRFGDEGGEVQLCVSELMANVIRQVGEGVPVTVRVARAGVRTRVAVSDAGLCVLPGVSAVTAHDESGRGLLLVDAVAVRWGVERGVVGKTVWCEVAGGEGEGGISP